MFAETLSRYVTRNSEILSGEPIIKGTRTSVRAIVGLWRLGVMPEEIINHLPHLTLAQVFDALSFYLDYQSEINDYIERNTGEAARRDLDWQMRHTLEEMVRTAWQARTSAQP